MTHARRELGLWIAAFAIVGCGGRDVSTTDFDSGEPYGPNHETGRETPQRGVQVDDCPTGSDCNGDSNETGGNQLQCDYPEGGTWLVDTNLGINDALSTVTSAMFSVMDELEQVLCLGPYQVEPWVCQAIVLLGDLDSMMDLMYVQQRLTLTETAPGIYDGKEEWVQFGFLQTDGTWILGAPGQAYNIEVDVEDFRAHATCNSFDIDSHHVSIDFCGMLRWALDVETSIFSGGLFSRVDDLARNACLGLSYPWDAACQGVVGPILDDLTDCGGYSLIDFDYEGRASHTGTTHLTNGQWDGTLTTTAIGGGDFDGSFSGSRM